MIQLSTLLLLCYKEMDRVQQLAHPHRVGQMNINEADVDKVLEVFPDLVRDSLRHYMESNALPWNVIVEMIAVEQVKLPRKSIEQIHDASAVLDQTSHSDSPRSQTREIQSTNGSEEWRNILLEEFEKRLTENYKRHAATAAGSLVLWRKNDIESYNFIKTFCSRLYVKCADFISDYGITPDCAFLAGTLLSRFTDDETTEKVILLFEQMIRQAGKPLIRNRTAEEAKIREILARPRKISRIVVPPLSKSCIPHSVPSSLKEVVEFIINASEPKASIFTCVICADDKLESNAIECTSVDGNEGECHKFCAECVFDYGKVSISEPNIADGGLGLKCMQPGCRQVLLHAAVIRCIPKTEKKERRLLEKRLVKAALIASGVPTEECRFCTYAEIIEDPPEINKVFDCEKCKAKFCRICKEIWSEHVGKKCEELKEAKFQDEQEKFRIALEEELSKISIRYCAACKLPFEKVEGCNKMTCRCGRFQCYLCHAQIPDYSHFCNHVRDPKFPNICPANCKKCLLWVNPTLQEKELRKRIIDKYRGKLNDETLSKLEAGL